MALTATFYFQTEGKDGEKTRFPDTGYLLCGFNCHTSRRHNEVRPDGNAQCEHIEISLVPPTEKDTRLMEWYANRAPMDCIVELGLTTGSKTITFKNAYCYDISENYHILSQTNRQLRLLVTAKELDTDGVLFKIIQE